MILGLNKYFLNFKITIKIYNFLKKNKSYEINVYNNKKKVILKDNSINYTLFY